MRSFLGYNRPQVDISSPQMQIRFLPRRCQVAVLAALFLAVAMTPAQDSLENIRQAFAHPPDDCRIVVRWWWFGPAVTKPEIQRELEQMKAAGIGGVEIAALYPLVLDDPQHGFRNLPFLSDDHIDALRFAANEARKLGLRVDITLGSGWPFGGPEIPVTHAAGQMRVEATPVPEGVHSIALPHIAEGESLAAIFLASGTGDALNLKDAKLLSSPDIRNDRLQISSSERNQTSLFFISSRTGMTVKRAAVGAEGFVLDHYDQNAIEAHLHAVGDRLLQAFGNNPPYAVFSDSLEDDDSDWTPDLLAEFQRRRGYDLVPYLPALVGDAGPDTAAVRHDWGQTLTELADAHYLKPLHAWAQQHHTLLRSQTYGSPPVTLSSNRHEDLPEGEGKATMRMWRQFSDTRWAASAGHLFGRPVISSETWTWLHSPAFRATPLDMKAEADLHFLQGINQLVGHGWPYSPEMAGDPGWRMYAAGAFNTHNPWWFAMSDLTTYLQRVSFALRQGEPANDVAVLLPNDDAWARFTVNSRSSSGATKSALNPPGVDVSIDDSMPDLLGKNLIPQILDSGFNLDFIDADAIDTVGIHYPVLVLPNIDRLPVATYRKIEDYAKNGGIVIATKRLPSTAPGLPHAAEDGREIRDISQRLFRSEKALAHYVEDVNRLGKEIAARFKPDVVFSPRSPELGFIRRKLPNGNLYFIANTANHPVSVSAIFRETGKYKELWDPFTGRIAQLPNSNAVNLSLQPYESRLIYITDVASSAPNTARAGRELKVIDLDFDWTATFNRSRQTVHLAKLHSWSDDEPFQYYSGEVTYEKTIDLPSDALSKTSVTLDFGQGTPIPIPDPLPEFNMQAYLDSPVREAAEVFVNGQRAGVVWHPPYTLDITALAKSGKNELRIVVGNTAINGLAGQTFPDYRLLNARYGERFVPQGMDHLKPLPSGLVGGLRLRFEARR